MSFTVRPFLATDLMQQLIRKQLHDFCWDSDDLDLAAVFWLRLFEAAASAWGVSSKSVHALEIRLRGFPRQRAAELHAELARRLGDDNDGRHLAHSRDFEVDEIVQLDEDSLSVSSRPQGEEAAPPSGLDCRCSPDGRLMGSTRKFTSGSAAHRAWTRGNRKFTAHSFWLEN